MILNKETRQILYIYKLFVSFKLLNKNNRKKNVIKLGRFKLLTKNTMFEKCLENRHLYEKINWGIRPINTYTLSIP